MGLKSFKPTSHGLRGVIGFTFEEITKTEPEKSLIRFRKQKAGRNFGGKISVRHRGGGARRYLRDVDFKRDKIGVPGKVVAIEYDPGRSARIALVNYADGEKRYILAPLGLGPGDTVLSASDAEIRPGNTLPLRQIPAGTLVHNIELQKGKGGQVVRSAGTAAQLMSKEESYALVRLPSGEVRKIGIDCMVTIGQVGNLEHQNIVLGKAGRNRWKGWRPAVRGSAMSPRDHPHGGGEGRSPRGMDTPKTPWGKPARGFKTRRRKTTDKMIVKDRRQK
ncbi:MAG: 50S ribosomal protein L2 [Chloroflexi bacterium]|nr:50S ribosomal protein L2 [Chloroflexota bacterium]